MIRTLSHVIITVVGACDIVLYDYIQPQQKLLYYRDKVAAVERDKVKKAVFNSIQQKL